MSVTSKQTSQSTVGARGGTRTRTSLLTKDFKSSASTIPPLEPTFFHIAKVFEKATVFLSVVEKFFILKDKLGINKGNSKA